MPVTVHTLSVTGTVATDSDSDSTMLVLSERLDGHDTFLTGRLVLSGDQAVSVRILTLDDVTVLRVLGDEPLSITDGWSGVLHLPHGWRIRSLPADLIAAATNARRNIGSLDEAGLRYALTFLGEASTAEIRRARIDLIIHALPSVGDAR